MKLTHKWRNFSLHVLIVVFLLTFYGIVRIFTADPIMTSVSFLALIAIVTALCVFGFFRFTSHRLRR